jgi:hypothetical protein
MRSVSAVPKHSRRQANTTDRNRHYRANAGGWLAPTAQRMLSAPEYALEPHGREAAQHARLSSVAQTAERTEGSRSGAVVGTAYVTYWLGIHCFQCSTVTKPSRW